MERWETDAKAAVKELVSDLRSQPDGLAKTSTALATENIQHVAQKAERLGLTFNNVKLEKTEFKVTFKLIVSFKSIPILITLPS